MVTIFDSKEVARLASHFCPVLHLDTGVTPFSYAEMMADPTAMLIQDTTPDASTSVPIGKRSPREAEAILEALKLLVPDAGRTRPHSSSDCVLRFHAATAAATTGAPAAAVPHLPVIVNGWTSGFSEFIDFEYAITVLGRDPRGCWVDIKILIRVAKGDDSGDAFHIVKVMENQSASPEWVAIDLSRIQFDPQHRHRIQLYIHSDDEKLEENARARRAGKKKGSETRWRVDPRAPSLLPPAPPGVVAQPSDVYEIAGILPQHVIVFHRPFSCHEGVWYRHLPLYLSTTPTAGADGDATYPHLPLPPSCLHAYFFTGKFAALASDTPARRGLLFDDADAVDKATPPMAAVTAAVPSCQEVPPLSPLQQSREGGEEEEECQHLAFEERDEAQGWSPFAKRGILGMGVLVAIALAGVFYRDEWSQL